MSNARLTCIVMTGLLAAPGLAAAQTLTTAERLLLGDGWTIQSSAHVRATGEELSTPRSPQRGASATYSTRGWYPTQVPTTVLAALVAAKIYPDPYFGMNLRQIPGASYPIGRNFAKLPMPPESPFRSSWWFRTEFDLPASLRGGADGASEAGRSIALHFDGINFRADVWLNGRRLAESRTVAGAYRRYAFDVTEIARPGEPNALAVEVFPPHADDLALTWVDWNPMAPDKAMGLWRDVYLTTSGPVALRHPHVVSDLDLPSLDSARLTISVDARNTTDLPVRGTLRGRIGAGEAVVFARDIELAAGETRTVLLEPGEHPQLALRRPALWWPIGMGAQNLHDLELSFEVPPEGGERHTDGQVSDRAQLRFGIREVTSELTAEGHRLFRVNGRRVLIRGGGWTPDMMLRFSPERMAAELAYVRDMGLNAIRLEGKMEPEPFFELTDRLGILVLAGWCCCSHWERWDDWRDQDHVIAAESLRSQILRLRAHPSLLVWLNGSDFPPPAEVETSYLRVLEELRWPNPVLSNATAKPAEHSGASGVKMNGPYEWIPPSYWLTDTRYGGAWGFATEVGPGPVVPPYESLRQMLPESSLWPIDEQWSFHAGGGRYKKLTVFTEALSARYGAPEGARDYAFKAQLLAYEGLRAMFEAYGREKYTATGVIQWMLNDAWPSMIWHLYDYYLRPGGAYFGAKKALEQIHVQYSYDDRSIAVVNGRYEALKGLKVSAKLYDLDMRERFSRTRTFDAGADSSTRAFVLPKVPPEGDERKPAPEGGKRNNVADLPATHFLKLELQDAAGELLSSNFYWLSTRQDVLDWDASTWFYTPVKQHADFTALSKLPAVELRVSARHQTEGDQGRTWVRLSNPSPHLAFAVHLRLTRGEGGDEVLPILWDDNYFELLPGQTREIGARYQLADLKSSEPVVEVDGWNVSAAPRPTP